MLAKVWKKVLLAVCILACIYNVMHKLVSRTSLEMQLKSVQNQESIIDMLNTDNKTEENKSSTTTKLEKNNTMQREETTNQNTVENKINDDKNTIVVIY